MTRIRRRLGYLGLGYLQVESYATTKREHQRCEAVIDKLIENKQRDVLRALIDGRVTLAELVDLDRKNDLTGASVLASVALHRPLWSEWERLEPQMAANVRTQKRYGVTRRQLQRLAKAWLPTDATVSALMTVEWSRLHATWPGSGSDWNHVRRGVSRFLSVLFADKHAAFRLKVVAAIPIAKEVERVPDLSVEAFWSILEHAREDVRPAFATLLMTGMRVGEYLACDESAKRSRTCTVAVPGGKTGARVVAIEETLWPWIEQGIPAPLAYKALRLQWIAACEKAKVAGVTLHDLRHAHAQWATDAGAQLVQVKAMLGHQSLAMSARYSRTKDQKAAASALARAIGGGR